MLFHCLLHSWGHHDDTDDRDQQEVECIHNPCSCGLFDPGAAFTAAGAGRRAATAGHLYRKERVDKRQEHNRF